MVRLDAHRQGEEKWGRGLGSRVFRARVQLPPDNIKELAEWNGSELLANLLEAISVLDGKRKSRPKVEDTACGLIKLGRAAAARACLYGEYVSIRKDPSAEMHEALQALNPRPEKMEDALDSLDEHAAEIQKAIEEIEPGDEITKEELLDAAQHCRESSAPGPDGMSGGVIKRLALVCKREMAGLLWDHYCLLRDTVDPLVSTVLLNATVGGIPKPDGKVRPITITQCISRCILARAVKRSRADLRRIMERGGQYGITGVTPCVSQLLGGIARCIREGAPWAMTNVDQRNAFNSVAQRALAEAALMVAEVAPELAACVLRSQCAINPIGDEDDQEEGGLGGHQELMIRGRYPHGTALRLEIKRFARGGAQGGPDMPVLFGAVMVRVDGQARRHACRIGLFGSVSMITGILWDTFRLVKAALGPDPPASWSQALRRILDRPRPRRAPEDRRKKDPEQGEVTAMYADDAHSAGWFPTALYRTLWRIIEAKKMASLEVNV